MSVRNKLSLIITAIFLIVLVVIDTSFYYSTRNLLIQEQEKQLETTASLISNSIAQSEYGKTYVENLIGRNLRTAAIAARLALPADVHQVSNEQLTSLAKLLDISHITLLAPDDNDIKGVRSSDPKEIDMSTKDWDYWYTAFEQLLKDKNVTIPEGQKLPNYWSGPVEVSSSDPTHLDKWGYYDDGKTNYIINPYVRDEFIHRFESITGPEAIVEKTTQDHKDILEITGFNPRTFGKPPVISNLNGSAYVKKADEAVQFGRYTYADSQNDAAWVAEAMRTGAPIHQWTTVKGQWVIKSFFPVKEATPYVIGIVADTLSIKQALHDHLVTTIKISLVLLVFIVIGIDMVSGLLVRPVETISERVKEIAKGQFDARVEVKGEDELGRLAHSVNSMTQDLQAYTQELLLSKEQNKHLANHDALTGLPNRRLFHEKLEHLLREAGERQGQVAVMLLDLDRFKMINDTLGHNTGDLFLQQVAARIVSCVGGQDAVARIGGDEFTVLLEITGAAEAVAAAQSIIDQLAHPYKIGEHELFTGSSIGISLFPSDGTDPETLLKHADTAMYRAKEQGGDRFLAFTAEMKRFSEDRIAMEKNLRRALEQEEIYVVYQPRVESSGRMTGMEALLRWNSSEHGFVPPSDFIPIAEETGFIVQLGEHVLRTACAQTKAWHDAGHDALVVSVNLSALQFRQHNLAEQIADILRETGLDPKRLELEITETILMDNMDLVVKSLRELRSMNIRIAIDDFGTGYSSLSYLKSFPIDTLKIDRSFVLDITDTAKGAEIASAIISLAHSLQLTVVAEGVESEAQVAFLQAKQCNELQGYYFSKPLPALEFERLLTKQ